MPRWRTWAHSFFLKQFTDGDQRRSGVEYFDGILQAQPVGIHDFPDQQRPLFAVFQIVGPQAGEYSTAMMGSFASNLATREGGSDIAVQEIRFRNRDAASSFGNEFNIVTAAEYCILYTPVFGEPDPVLNNFSANIARLRPQPAQTSTRAFLLGGTNPNIVSWWQSAPRVYHRADLWYYGGASLNGNPILPGMPVPTALRFNPPLIIPPTQFVALTSPVVNTQLETTWYFRELSP